MHQLPGRHVEHRRPRHGHHVGRLSLARVPRRADRRDRVDYHQHVDDAPRGAPDDLRGRLRMKPLALVVGGELGAVLPMFAIWLPVLALCVVLVVDVANWFEHKRHLQMQADAGALAGGTGFTFPCSDTSIETITRKYGGDPAASNPYNLQVAPTQTANVHLLVNSDKYWNE